MAHGTWQHIHDFHSWNPFQKKNTDDLKSFHDSPAFLEKGLIPAEEGWDRNVPGEAVVGGGGGQKAGVARSS